MPGQPCSCLTRVVMDDAGGVEAAQLHAAMQTIQSALMDIPAVERGYIADALLSHALARVAAGKGCRESGADFKL